MKRILLIVCAALLAVANVSAQQQTTTESNKKQKQSKSFDWKSMYRAEVSVGMAITGAHPKGGVKVPGGSGGGGYDGPEAGSVSPVAHAAGGTYYSRLNANFTRPFVETVHGLQINKYLFAGVGAGLQFYCGKLHDFYSYSTMAAEIKGKKKAAERWNALAMPLFVAVRGMYPINEDLVPFVNLGIGGTVVFNSAINFKYSEQGSYVKQALRGGFYCDFGGGIRWKRLSGSIGLQHQIVKSVTDSGVTGELASADKVKVNIRTNAFYLKVGWNF